MEPYIENQGHWLERIEELKEAATRTENQLAELKAAYFKDLANEEDVTSQRELLDEAELKATEAAETLKAAKEQLAEAIRLDATEDNDFRASAIQTAQGEMREYQRKALDSLKPFIEALQAFEAEAQDMDYVADNPLRRLMHDRYGPVALFMTAMLEKEVPLLIEPLARCASDSRDTAQWCEGKTLEGVSEDYLTGFEKRNPIDWGSF